jgi:hypothetical protein
MDLADVALAFLIGAGLGVAASLLLRDAPPARGGSGLGRRVRRLRSLDRELRKAMATLRRD